MTAVTIDEARQKARELRAQANALVAIGLDEANHFSKRYEANTHATELIDLAARWDYVADKWAGLSE